MEKKLTRDELLKELIEKAKDIFTTAEQKYDIVQILQTSSSFKGKNHLFLVQCYFNEIDILFSLTKEDAIRQALLAVKEGSDFGTYYLYLLWKEDRPIEARNALRMCCDRGYKKAFLEMAKCKHYGEIFQLDRKGALEYYRKAALSGMKEGYEGLMKLYLELGMIDKEKEVYEEAKKKGVFLSGVVE